MVSSEWGCHRSLFPPCLSFRPLASGFRLHYPHSSSYFFQIAGEKAELAKKYAYQYHCQRPENSDQYNVYDYPKPFLLYVQQIHDTFTCIAGEAAPDSKCAKDKYQLEAADLPFFL